MVLLLVLWYQSLAKCSNHSFVPDLDIPKLYDFGPWKTDSITDAIEL